MRIDQNVSIWIPVVLTDTSGAPKTGVVAASVTCYLRKGQSAAVAKALDGTNWAEIDPVAMPGHYEILLSTTDTNTLGFLRYVVTATLTTGFQGLAQVTLDTAHLLQIRHIAEGRWKIDTTTNQLLLFGADGATVIQRFNLLDRSGNPTNAAIFERVPTIAIP